MAFRTLNEFNAVSVMPQELQLRLMNLALNGETVASVFTAMADRAGVTERGRAARERELAHYDSIVRIAMASQERVAEFQKRLDELERASYEALIENEERLHEANKKLARIREQAYEITMPDGGTAKVYRDGDKVRDDDGREVSDRTIRAEDIPDAAPDWSIRRAAGQEVEKLSAQRTKIIEYREKIDNAREATAEGRASEDELKDLDSALSDMPDAVRRHTGESERKPEGKSTLTRLAPDASVPGPA